MATEPARSPSLHTAVPTPLPRRSLTLRRGGSHTPSRTAGSMLCHPPKGGSDTMSPNTPQQLRETAITTAEWIEKWVGGVLLTFAHPVVFGPLLAVYGLHWAETGRWPPWSITALLYPGAAVWGWAIGLMVHDWYIEHVAITYDGP